MKKSKCVHPRKARTLMEDFVNTASDLFNTDNEKIDIIIRKDKSFMAKVPHCVAKCDEIEVNYNFDELYNENAKIFRRCWSLKAPILKGFSDITISLLHELGHLETNDEIRKTFHLFVRELAMIGIQSKAESIEEANVMYFLLPDEKMATEWAIQWLSVKENRKLAKKFEKKFFKCFE